MRSIALFGGAFDPVHHGHLQTSIAIQGLFHFNQYFFLPCKTPTLKAPSLASNQQRLEMLQLALSPYPEFKIDTREIERDSPSYMVETLTSVRSEHPEDSITLIIGYDAFLSLPRWHQWEKLIMLANILIFNRKQYHDSPLSKELENLISIHQGLDSNDILNHKAGKIAFFDAGDYEISSTSIREKVKKQQDFEHDLPDVITEYIRKNNLYL